MRTGRVVEEPLHLVVLVVVRRVVLRSHLRVAERHLPQHDPKSGSASECTDVDGRTPVVIRACTTTLPRRRTTNCLNAASRSDRSVKATSKRAPTTTARTGRSALPTSSPSRRLGRRRRCRCRFPTSRSGSPTPRSGRTGRANARSPVRNPAALSGQAPPHPAGSTNHLPGYSGGVIVGCMLLKICPQVWLHVQHRHSAGRAGLLEEQLQIVVVRGHRRRVGEVGVHALPAPPIDTPGFDWNNW